MVRAILGRKIGMTQMYDDNGFVTPVTALSVGPCVVLGITEKNIRLGYEDIEDKKVKKPQLGMFKKLNIKPKRIIREIDSRPIDKEIKIGQEINVDIFKSGDFVDAIGITIGKGFQGGMKRWHWKGQPRAHGSMMHRRPGSIGASADPSRVFKGQHMPGHMGNQQRTAQNLKVMRVDPQNNILLIKGQVPGHRTSLLIIKDAKKKQFLVKKQK